MSKQGQVTSLLHEPESADRDRKVAQVLDSMIDYDALAKRSLAGHWDDLSAAQRKEFSGLLKQLVQRSYQKNIQGILDWNVEYLSEEPADPGVTVHTRATSKTNPRADPVTIDYALAERSGSYRVDDIVTEGSSLVGNYKNQFNRILQKDGYDALIRRMRQKIAQGGEEHVK